MSVAVVRELRRIFKNEPIDSHLCYNCESAKHVKLFENVVYIVGAILFDASQEKIVLVQEAKRSIRGTWYYPAGRVESNETLREAVRREVMEEAGLSFDPLSISHVQMRHLSWFRFTFIGTFQGTLKSTPDDESLSADFERIQNLKSGTSPRPMRGVDFVRLIDDSLRIHKVVSATRRQDDHGASAPASVQPITVLPKEVGLRTIVFRLCVVYFDEHTFDLLLVRHQPETARDLGADSRSDAAESAAADWHVPLIAASDKFKSLESMLADFEANMFSGATATRARVEKQPIALSVTGVLGIQHSGKQTLDGLVLTLLVRADSRLPLANTAASTWGSCSAASVASITDEPSDRINIERFNSLRDARQLIPLEY